MPKYKPLDPGVGLKASHSDLIAFQWQTNGICADFSIPDDEGHLLRVTFDRPCIVRLLDEMPLPLFARAHDQRAQASRRKQFAGSVRMNRLRCAS